MPKFGRTVIVNPNRDETEDLIHLLQGYNIFRVDTLESCEEAAQLFASSGNKFSFRLIFLDVSDFTEAVRLVFEIMSNDQLSHIQIIAVGRLQNSQIHMLAENGVSSFIPDLRDSRRVRRTLTNLSNRYRIRA